MFEKLPNVLEPTSVDPHFEIEKLSQRVRELEGKREFGLTWRNIPEAVERRLVEEVPVLVARTKLDVAGGIPSDRAHILIEGDNLHALHTLQATHKGLVDVIYIDPPYNTGNEFIYNDKLIDKENPFRHSAWLSFMAKRLTLAKALLKASGIIYISIDDNEQAHLRLLCDQVFGEGNFIGCLPTVMNLKGNQDEFGFAGTHEYTIVYARSKAEASLGLIPVDDEDLLDDWDLDETGWWKKGAGLKATGVDAPRSKRPTMYYPLYVARDGGIVRTERTLATDDEVWPITDSAEMRWRWQKTTAKEKESDLIAVGKSPSWTIYKKQRPGLGDLPSKKPKSILYRPEYSSTNGTNMLKKVLGGRVFPNPKPVDLLADLIFVATTGESPVVLDFFAGSGTTLQAVATLNSRDGKFRQCILVTNNENKICREVTQPRIKAVLTGKWADGNHDPLPGTLKFYTTEFIVRRRSVDRMRSDIAEHTVDLVAIKEGTSKQVVKQDDLAILHGYEKTVAVVPALNPAHKKLYTAAEKHVRKGNVRIAYLFTWSEQGIEEEVVAMWPGWNVQPLPAEMLAALRRTVPATKQLFDTNELVGGDL